MPDFQKGKIYKLWSPSENLVYYGSTVETLAQRLAKHKCSYKSYNNDNTKLYTTSYLVLDCEDYKMELVEEYPCNNRQQLLIKEGEYIKNNECVNKCVAGRTKIEYLEITKEERKAKMREYREANKDIINERQKERYKLNDDEWKEKRNEKVRQRRQLNKEAYNAYQREYYKKKLKQNKNINL